MHRRQTGHPTEDSDELHLARTLRGRPRGEANRQVVQRLLDTTELLLQDHSHLDLTERKIAAAAGVNFTMIHYYFGGKDGLLFSVFVRYYDEMAKSLQALDTIDLNPNTVSRDIVKILIDVYLEKPWIVRILLSEFVVGRSPIREFYLQKYGSRGLGLVRIQQIFDKLTDLGIYDREINSWHAAVSTFSTILGPLMMAPFCKGDAKLDVVPLKEDVWIDYLAELLDRQFGVAKDV